MDKNYVTGKNWMSQIDDNKMLTEINIPGTHDSSTQIVGFSSISKTQDLSIGSQLEIGVRYFDMRATLKDGEYVTCHSIMHCHKDYGIGKHLLTFSDVLNTMYAFLDSNPTETILFALKEDKGSTEGGFYETFYNMYIRDNHDKWYTDCHTPTMGQARGKIVMCLRGWCNTELMDDTRSGISFKNYPYMPSLSDTDLKVADIEDTNGNFLMKLVLQDTYQLKAHDKITAIKKFRDYDKKKSDFNIVCTCTSRALWPRINAIKVNSYLMNNPISKDEYVGVMYIDFATEEIVRMIYSSNDIDVDFNSKAKLEENTQTNMTAKFEKKYLDLFKKMVEKCIKA